MAKYLQNGITLLNNESKIGIFFNVLISYGVQLIWDKMTDISFLTILSLVSINIVGIANVIQTALFGFITLDLLQTDKWMTQLIFSNDQKSENYDFIERENTPLTSSLEENGFSTKNIINNLGSTFVYLVFSIFSIILYEIFKIIIIIRSYYLGRNSKPFKIEKKIYWNGILNFIIV